MLLSICAPQRELPAPSHSSPRSGAPPGDEGLPEPVEERTRDRPPGQSHSSLRRNGTIHHPRPANADLSCLLTPPNTPLYPDGGGPGPMLGHAPQTNGCLSRTVAESKKINGLITNGLEGMLVMNSEYVLRCDIKYSLTVYRNSEKSHMIQYNSIVGGRPRI